MIKLNQGKNHNPLDIRLFKRNKKKLGVILKVQIVNHDERDLEI